MSSNITVVVRCRPLNARELARGAIELIKMEGNNTFLEKPQVNLPPYARCTVQTLIFTPADESRPPPELLAAQTTNS